MTEEASATTPGSHAIGEHTSGSSSCGFDSLNTVTKEIHDEMHRAGWDAGYRRTNSATHPLGYLDRVLVPEGRDHHAIDTGKAAIYAGHGNRRRISFNSGKTYKSFRYGTTKSRCYVYLDDMSMGNRGPSQPDGGQAATMMYITSCTLHKTAIGGLSRMTPPYMSHRTLQNFGFHNSPSVSSGQPRIFLLGSTNGRTNKRAWLDRMQWNQNDQRKNSSMVISSGPSAASAASTHENWTGYGVQGTFPASGWINPWTSSSEFFFYSYSYKDNGGNTCG
ncbi:MAG: hypothetical protein V3V08_02585 [Nannocystaceae bacterium]